jgi:hypothetical protein
LPVERRLEMLQQHVAGGGCSGKGAGKGGVEGSAKGKDRAQKRDEFEQEM